MLWFHSDAASGLQDRLDVPGSVFVSPDLPSSGELRLPGEPAGLAGWRHRIERGLPWLEPLMTDCRELLDRLAPTRPISVGGISRGAFIALHLAVRDERVTTVAALAPLVDLAALSEFAGVDPRTLQPFRIPPADLAGKTIWLSVNSKDDRISTASVLDLVAAIVAAGNGRAAIELHVTPGVDHGISEAVRVRAALWLARQTAPAAPVAGRTRGP